ncbi:response regulator transcription factor [Clostridium sp. D53t1_180928_C8]|uniref:response regulator transcription factor n=1 Tax=Clostridium sp. D53t1_180928_C8 TaxID=2787101 RepID=UPI00325FA1B9
MSALDGLEGVKKFNDNEEIDLIILDVMLPNLDGFTVLNRIRKKSNIPVIMVTARGDKEDVLMGYEYKVDDYITKPFNLDILLAKVNVLLDRIEILSNTIPEKVISDLIEINGVKLDKLSFKIYVDNEEIQIERKQFEILQYLMGNKNIVISNLYE